MTKRAQLIRAVCCFAIIATFLFHHPKAHRATAQTQAGQEGPHQPAVAAAGTRHLSIPAAAFVPGAEYYSYENHGRFLKYLAGPPAVETGYFVAPVQLPQGAILSSLTFHYRDTTAGQAVARLLRHRHDTEGGILMAELASSDTWTPGFGSTSTTSFNPTPLIDNSQHSYYVNLSLPPGGQVWGCSIEIEYYPPAQPPPHYQAECSTRWLPALRGWLRL